MDAPPIAERHPHQLEAHGHVRIDDYYWLRDRDNPAVLDYLKAENAYTEAAMAPAKPLQDRLYNEIKDRVQETDMSVPYHLDGYWYYVRTETGKSYPIFCRKFGDSAGAPEEITLDCNALAEGQPFFALMGHSVSPDTRLLAYATDTVGRRIATIRVKDLTTGELLDDVIENVTGNLCWANDNQTIFYSKQDLDTLRSHRIYRHRLGADPREDALVYEETDETFSVHVTKSKSRRYIFIAAHQTVSSEYRYLDADTPTGDFQVFHAREREHEYAVRHFGEHFYILTNWDAVNFRLMRCPVTNTQRDGWEEVIPHRNDVLIRGIDVFRGYMVVSEREAGLVHLRIRSWDGARDHRLDFGEPAYGAGLGHNPELDTDTLRYIYTSLTTPNSVYAYHMESREKTLLKQEPVLGGFDQSHYVTDRIFADAPGGARVPISLVHRKDTPRDGSAPLLLYGYGSYGASMDAAFSSPRVSLLDRGFVFAIAHVRGGQELGRSWYDEGRLLNKKNTFTDYIACARHLINEHYTSSAHLYGIGGSAGGLLIGAVVNMAPGLFQGAIAKVPFVDIVTTMLDPDIPLTTSEYDEWGNPHDKTYYDYILSYSPYDNVAEQEYPHLLVTTGLHDSQVQYWEPAKWVAKLRRLKTDDHRLLLKTNLEAGHGGASGRYKRYEEIAFDYAFLLDLEGIHH